MEKAESLSNELAFELTESFSLSKDQRQQLEFKVYYTLKEMAEWKDKQFKTKVENLFNKLQNEGYNDRVKSGFEIFKDELKSLLKENEDERIRKGIIEYLEQSQFGEEHYQIDDDIVRNYIAWLEKQGKQTYWKPSEEQLQTLHAQLNEGAVTYSEDRRILSTLYEDLMKIITQEEKQGEKKLENSAKTFKDEQNHADKTKPKFNADDWVVPNIRSGGELLHIIDKDNENYEIETPQGNTGVPSIEYVDNHFHLWTIQDAQDGDVLSWDESKCIALFKKIDNEYSFSSYGFVGHCTGIFETKLSYHDIDLAHPATKEQRDILFNKMREAGYEWDSLKKRLLKKERKNEREKMDL